MTDRPILFSGPMVRALLDGRKTQTRRVLTGGRMSLFNGEWSDSYVLDPGNADWRQRDVRFAVGDRLWVREAWQSNGLNWGKKIRDMALGLGPLHYAATDSGGWKSYWGGWKPGIHMPRWASRLTLAVTEVRIGRLQDISKADAIAEGIEFVTRTGSGDFYRNFANPGCPLMAYGAYRSLWDSLNAKRGFGWDANPWVVALTFTVHHQNIDAPGAREAA